MVFYAVPEKILCRHKWITFPAAFLNRSRTLDVGSRLHPEMCGPKRAHGLPMLSGRNLTCTLVLTSYNSRILNFKIIFFHIIVTLHVSTDMVIIRCFENCCWIENNCTTYWIPNLSQRKSGIIPTHLWVAECEGHFTLQSVARLFSGMVGCGPSG
jgi:hypothetical protein